MHRSHPVEEFHFPNEVLKYKIIKNLQHFREMISRQNNLLRRNITFEPTLITGSDSIQTLNLQCKQCDAFLSYIRLKDGQFLNLKDFNQRHKHIIKQVHTFQQSIIERINKFLLQVDNKQQLHELRAQIETTYRITSKQFQNLYSQALGRLKNNGQLYDSKQIQELTQKLNIQRFTVTADYLPSRNQRETKKNVRSIVITNEQMAVNYKKYGEFCYFSVDDKNPINRWYVGAIMGMGWDMELSLFGLFLVKYVDSDHLKGVLKAHLNLVEFKPLTIITQNAFYFDQALLELKQQGYLEAEHLYDYSIQAERLHRNNPKFKKIFGEICRQPLKQKFFNKLEQQYNSDNFYQLSLDLEDLVSQASKICLSQIKAVPVGPYFTVRNKNTKKKYDFSIIRNFHKIMFERQCHIGKHLYSKVKNILKFLSIPTNDQTAQRNRIMDIFPEILQLRQIVSKSVMEYLMGKVYVGLQLRWQKVSDESYLVHQHKNIYYKVYRQNEKWCCQCQESIKTTLPCAHEMLVCCSSGSPMQVQVGKRWTNDDEKLYQEMKTKMFRRPRSKRVTLSEFLA